MATVAQRGEFDEIIDARTPAEFVDDHIPGALNLPVLDNEQRIVVGTMYKQQSPFEARKLGAAMVAANIAHHLQAVLHDRPRSWRPLVYCWRGGQRSGAFVTWLRLIGWDAHQLAGGYKTFRHHVIARLEALAPVLELRVVCGPTGSGKTRVLEALARQGAQMIDLEGLAAHKGSVLGGLPDRAQPTQKAFETRLAQVMEGLDPARPVYVEAESRRIGKLFVPEPLLAAMRSAPCVAIEASRAARLKFLVRDYAYLGDDISHLQGSMARLAQLHSRQTIERWQALAAARALPALFAELIDLHYDPLYQRSQNKNYIAFEHAPHFACDDLSPAGVDALAARIAAAG